jgi:hypothetical protein
MSTPRLPHLFRLSPADIADVIRSMRLKRAGAKLYFAIDPYDLIEFCYPVTPGVMMQDVDIETIADDQAALFEVFVRRLPRPLLINEYTDEVRRNLNRIRTLTKEAFTKTEILKEMIRFAGQDPSSLKTLAALEQDYGVFLAVAMGIFSIGAERLEHVLSKRLDLEQSLPPELQQALAEYKSTEVVPAVYAELIRSIRKDEVATEKLNRQRAARTDATAIDRLIFLNVCAERLFISGQLPCRYIYLYLSSATRSQKALRVNAVRNNLPAIDGEPFNFLVTKSQLFATVALKPRVPESEEDSPHDIDQLLANLAKFQAIVQQIYDRQQSDHQLGPACSTCVLSSGAGEGCGWMDVCRQIAQFNEEIKPRTAIIQNLGLLTNITRYRELLDAQTKDQQEKKYLDRFKALFQDRGLGDLALKRLNLIQGSMLLESEFVSAIPLGLVSELEADSVITTGNAASPSMPTAVQVMAPNYRGLSKSAVNAFRAENQDHRGKRHLLLGACNDFLALDSQEQNKEKGADHELTRNILYCAFARTGSAEADVLAKKHARRMFGTFEEVRPEFAYLWIHAEMRSGNFDRVDETLRQFIRDWPYDPRFHQLRSAQISALVSASEAKGEKHPKYNWNDALLSGQRALDGYKREKDSQGLVLLDESYWSDIIGMLCNNVAYFSLMSEGDNEERKLTQALAAMEELRTVIPEERWPAEYLHTQACVYYHQVMFRGLSDDEREKVLERAERFTDRALQTRPKKLYADFLRTIKEARQRHATNS